MSEWDFDFKLILKVEMEKSEIKFQKKIKKL